MVALTAAVIAGLMKPPYGYEKRTMAGLTATHTPMALKLKERKGTGSVCVRDGGEEREELRGQGRGMGRDARRSNQC